MAVLVVYFCFGLKKIPFFLSLSRARRVFFLSSFRIPKKPPHPPHPILTPPNQHTITPLDQNPNQNTSKKGRHQRRGRRRPLHWVRRRRPARRGGRGRRLVRPRPRPAVGSPQALHRGHGGRGGVGFRGRQVAGAKHGGRARRRRPLHGRDQDVGVRRPGAVRRDQRDARESQVPARGGSRGERGGG